MRICSTRDRIEFGTRFGGMVTWNVNPAYGRGYGALDATCCGSHDGHCTPEEAAKHAVECPGIPLAPPVAPPPTPPLGRVVDRLMAAIRRND